MAQGLQTFNSDGSLDTDVTNRLPRFLGMVSISESQNTGVIYNEYINQSTDVWWFLMNASTNFSASDGDVVRYEYPTMEKGNGYLKWTFPSGRRLACTMLYGVY